MTALMLATDCGHVSVVEVLLRHGAQVDLKNEVTQLLAFFLLI